MSQTAYWPWPPDCFTWRPCPFAGAADRLAERDLRRVVQHVDAELRLEPAHLHVEVRLAHAVDHGLVRLLVPLDPERRVLLAQAREPGRELVLVALGRGLDRVGEQRLRQLDGRQGRRRVLRRPGVAGVCVLQLRDRADVAGRHLRDGLVVLAALGEELADPLLGALGRVVHGGVGPDRSGEHAKHRDVPDEGVRDGLEHVGGERSVRVRRALELGLPPSRAP